MPVTTRESRAINGLAAYAQPECAHPQILIEEHTGLIKKIALHLAARVPPTVDMDDLIQAGAIGLLESAQRFDPSHGASFATYASIRIRGAMLDELRRYDWSPRSTRRKIREMSEVIRKIEGETGREASEADVAAGMGMSSEDYRNLLQDSVSFSVFSWDALLEQRGDSIGSAAEEHDDPEHHVEAGAFSEYLASVIETLPPREQMVLALYYDQECNLKEIGQILGVSESRVCQIHGQILARMRSRLDPEMIPKGAIPA
ncbi:MAG: RNA polymerase sigma factor FliA [Pseudomonadota bacterium]